MAAAKLIYLTADELVVLDAALTLYAMAFNGKEFGVHAEADNGMRARGNLARSARAKIRRERASRQEG